MVVIASYDDISCSTKSYLCTDDGKSIMAFVNEESARLFLKTSRNYSEEQLDMFLYEEVT